MRRMVAFLVALLLSVPTYSGELSADKLEPGCIITSRQIVQFVLDPKTCEWVYVPGNARSAPAFVRGKRERFTVTGIELRDGREYVITYQYIIFDLEDMQIFSFERVHLENKRVFSLSTKTPA